MATPAKQPQPAKNHKATQPYQTLTEVKHDGEDIPVGGTIELTDKQAEQLLALGAVKPE